MKAKEGVVELLNKISPQHAAPRGLSAWARRCRSR